MVYLFDVSRTFTVTTKEYQQTTNTKTTLLRTPSATLRGTRTRRSTESNSQLLLVQKTW